MTVPIDITDQTLVKAYAHPLRATLLGLLDGRIASPSELATELGASLGTTSYHIRCLRDFGLVELVAREPRRGAIEHYYTATLRPTISNEAWAQLPKIVKRASLDASLQHAVTRIATAAQEGGFDREDIHYSRSSGWQTRAQWDAISRSLAAALRRVEANVEPEPPSEGDAEYGTVVLMHFAERPPLRLADKPSSPGVDARGEGTAAR